MAGLLAGLTLVEGASFIAAPSCGLHFAQMGARVIRFDQMGGGPDARRWPISEAGHSLYWEGLNKGKQSIAIDLSRPEGREIAQRLATSGDGLFVTSFPASGFLSYDRLAALRADLVCLRVMGWSDGEPAVDYTINAAVGVPMMTGHPDDPRPVNHVLPAWDLLAGAYGAFAILAALREREASGAGRDIRLALSDLAAAALGNLGLVAETGQAGDRPRAGNDLFGAFGRDFATRDGRRVMIVAITPRQWRGLVAALDIGEAMGAAERATGADFAADEGARWHHRERLFAIVAGAVAARNVDDLRAPFAQNGVCWSIYRSLSDAMANEPRLFADNDLFAPVAHPSGIYPTPASPARIGGAGVAAGPAPRLGGDTDAVLAELLGMGSGEIGRLHDEGLVG